MTEGTEVTDAMERAQAVRTEAELEAHSERLRDAGAFIGDVRAAVARRVVGQETMIERLIIGLLSGGHVLLEGVPGLAKTLAVRSLADAIDTTFHRIQFTPDLLPADLIGTLIWEETTRRFVPKKGPIFANLILADEINRAPAKVQSALLEAMQERQVTIGEESHPVPVPFLVLATQNPIEHEGTYPLPEAQVDRFMLKVRVDYPGREEEREILRRVVVEEIEPLRPVASPEHILAARAQLPAIRIDSRVENYILDLVRATREPAGHDDELEGWIEIGASPRATIYLGRAARARALLEGRPFVIPEDVHDLAPDVLRHRVVMTFEAEAEEITADQVVRRLLEVVPVP